VSVAEDVGVGSPFGEVVEDDGEYSSNQEAIEENVVWTVLRNVLSAQQNLKN
jgi:hypothetical protein